MDEERPASVLGVNVARHPGIGRKARTAVGHARARAAVFPSERRDDGNGGMLDDVAELIADDEFCAREVGRGGMLGQTLREFAR